MTPVANGAVRVRYNTGEPPLPSGEVQLTAESLYPEGFDQIENAIVTTLGTEQALIFGALQKWRLVDPNFTDPGLAVDQTVTI